MGIYEIFFYILKCSGNLKCLAKKLLEMQGDSTYVETFQDTVFDSSGLKNQAEITNFFNNVFNYFMI